MAESDIRLESLEDEVKVLKGEVKRTLVDLRALLMREDSPLAEGALARRMALQNPAPMPGPAAAAVEAPQPAAAAPAPASETPAPGPGPGPGPGAPPAAAADAAPGPEPQQEPQEEPGRELSADQLMAQMAGLSTGQDGGAAAPEDLAAGDTEEEMDAPEAEVLALGEMPPGDTTRPGPTPHANGHARPGAKSLREGPSRQRPPQAEAAGPEEAREAKEADQDRANGKREDGSSIYDEYRQLLAETRQTHTLEDLPAGPPLDVNLLSNLVYWASLAKQRVGEEQMQDLLQLYIQSGHSSPQLQALLLHICRMVDVPQAELEEKGSDWVDLMFHLHGILTGGFPVIKIPQVKLPELTRAEGPG